MKYFNLLHPKEKYSFKSATIKGLGKDKGLFVPEKIPKLPFDFFTNIESSDPVCIATETLFPFVEGSLKKEELKQMLKEVLCFEIPVVNIKDNINILELFHGPTMAFKDIGARFMARCLGKFAQKNKEVTVLVATSGDTGSAVANGFHKVEGVRVVILFPKGKVSEFQEYQMTSLGDNITAIEVDGTFDDCQALVKQALHDEVLNKKLQLSSANSINVARFLPQMIYYFFAYKQLKNQLKNRAWYVSVPSGNFGNITAGLYAQALGLPIKHFVAANNKNDTFYQYLKTGNYVEKPSVSTYSNAMDVGAPSNFVRVQHLFNNNYTEIKNAIAGSTIPDEAVLEKISNQYNNNAYLLDPHTAVALLALEEHLPNNAIGTVLSTAHPNKFEAVMQKAIPDFVAPKVDLSQCKKESIANNYGQYLRHILA